MTWSKADLDAANAALRLGDVVVPPLGTVVQWQPPARFGMSLLTPTEGLTGYIDAREPNGPLDDPTAAWALRAVTTGGSYALEPHHIVSLVCVPVSAPPFDEWPRLPRPAPQVGPVNAPTMVNDFDEMVALFGDIGGPKEDD